MDLESISSGCIEIQVLDYYSQLLKAQFQANYGLLPPSLLYQEQMSQQIPTNCHVPVDADAVQIHYLQGHYVVSAKYKNSITVYDSLRNSCRIQALQQQLINMYGNISSMDIKYVVSQSQGSTLDCGVFAAANAFTLMKEKTPETMKYLQSSLRKHLKLCLENAIITEFPVQKGCDMNMINNYFHDQAQKRNEKGLAMQNKENLDVAYDFTKKTFPKTRISNRNSYKMMKT